LVLAKTVLHRPRVMILDEPASGMDPLSRRNLRFALRRLADDGATIIVSSHILGELAEMCTSLCVMNRGRLLASGSVDDVRQVLGRTERTLSVTVMERAEEAAEWIAVQPGAADVRPHGSRLAFRFTGSQEEQAALVAGLIGLGLRVTAFEEQKSTFEDILVEVAEGNAAS
jgi:ABC-2 type transport system ATP-binding protein